jgi:hypothetical protein
VNIPSIPSTSACLSFCPFIFLPLPTLFTFSVLFAGYQHNWSFSGLIDSVDPVHKPSRRDYIEFDLLSDRLVLRVQVVTMKLALSALGKIKLGFHSLQALLVFITICVAIAMDAQHIQLGLIIDTQQILWLAAWASLVAWVRNGMTSGADKLKVSPANCTTFDPDLGTEKKCSLGNTLVGFGVVIL